MLRMVIPSMIGGKNSEADSARFLGKSRKDQVLSATTADLCSHVSSFRDERQTPCVCHEGSLCRPPSLSCYSKYVYMCCRKKKQQTKRHDAAVTFWWIQDRGSSEKHLNLWCCIGDLLLFPSSLFLPICTVVCLFSHFHLSESDYFYCINAVDRAA